MLRTEWTDKDLGRFWLILTLFGAYLGITALLEHTPAAPLLLPPAIGDPSIAQHWGRSRGPFIQAEFDGAVMTQLLPVAVLLFVRRDALSKVLGGLTVVALDSRCLSH